MKRTFKIAAVIPAFILMFIAELSPELPAPYVQLVPDAHAIFGVRRRSFVVGAEVGAASASAASSTAAANQQAAAAQQQAAAAQKQAATAEQQAAAAQQRAQTAPPPPAATGALLPMGTVVSALPGGCTSTPVGGVEYYYCGGNFYRAMFQGNQLVYVTAKPN